MDIKKILTVIAFFGLAAVFSAGGASAAINMSFDTNMLDFRTINPGESRDLADKGVYHNQATLSSTNSKTWYLKAHLVRPFTSGMNTIPIGNFQWMVVSVGDGKGYVTNNTNIPNAFTPMPSVIYTSADTDNTGTTVRIQFKYLLTIPKDQVAGGYDAVVRFTMIEQL